VKNIRTHIFSRASLCNHVLPNMSGIIMYCEARKQQRTCNNVLTESGAYSVEIATVVVAITAKDRCCVIRVKTRL